MRFTEVFGLLFSGYFRFVLYINPHSDTRISKLVFERWRGAPYGGHWTSFSYVSQPG